METNEKRAGTKNLFIGAIVVLLLVNAFTFFSYLSEKTVKNDLGVELSSLEHEFNSLTVAFDQASAELEGIKTDHEKLSNMLAEKQEEVHVQKKQIESLLAKGNLTKGELAKAKKMLAEYEASINDLNLKVDALVAQNQSLTMQNQTLFADLGNEKQLTSQLSEQNKYLAKKVDVGSLLPIANLDVDAVKTGIFGREVNAKRAKVAEGLRISFETGDNKVLDPGTVSVYVRIINPKGETISVAENGSGLIQLADKNEPIPFTRRADINWTQENKRVLLYWNQHISEPGLYKVELYQNGYVIGQSEVKLS
jgi:regulatory protein YycI of two-component signal transduction system YycFG